MSSDGSLAEDDDEQLSLLIYMQKVPVGLLAVDISAQQVVFCLFRQINTEVWWSCRTPKGLSVF